MSHTLKMKQINVPNNSTVFSIPGQKQKAKYLFIFEVLLPYDFHVRVFGWLNGRLVTLVGWSVG